MNNIVPYETGGSAEASVPTQQTTPQHSHLQPPAASQFRLSSQKKTNQKGSKLSLHQQDNESVPTNDNEKQQSQMGGRPQLPPSVPPLLPCPSCWQPLDITRLTEHIEQNHIGQHRSNHWNCGQCRFQAANFDEIGAHSIRFDHNASWIRREKQQLQIDCLQEIQNEIRKRRGGYVPPPPLVHPPAPTNNHPQPPPPPNGIIHPPPPTIQQQQQFTPYNPNHQRPSLPPSASSSEGSVPPSNGIGSSAYPNLPPSNQQGVNGMTQPQPPQPPPAVHPRQHHRVIIKREMESDDDTFFDAVTNTRNSRFHHHYPPPAFPNPPQPQRPQPPTHHNLIENRNNHPIASGRDMNNNDPSFVVVHDDQSSPGRPVDSPKTMDPSNRFPHLLQSKNKGGGLIVESNGPTAQVGSSGANGGAGSNREGGGIRSLIPIPPPPFQLFLPPSQPIGQSPRATAKQHPLNLSPIVPKNSLIKFGGVEGGRGNRKRQRSSSSSSAAAAQPHDRNDGNKMEGDESNISPATPRIHPHHSFSSINKNRQAVNELEFSKVTEAFDADDNEPLVSKKGKIEVEEKTLIAANITNNNKNDDKDLGEQQGEEKLKDELPSATMPRPAEDPSPTNQEGVATGEASFLKPSDSMVGIQSPNHKEQNQRRHSNDKGPMRVSTPTRNPAGRVGIPAPFPLDISAIMMAPPLTRHISQPDPSAVSTANQGNKKADYDAAATGGSKSQPAESPATNGDACILPTPLTITAALSGPSVDTGGESETHGSTSHVPCLKCGENVNLFKHPQPGKTNKILRSGNLEYHIETKHLQRWKEEVLELSYPTGTSGRNQVAGLENEKPFGCSGCATDPPRRFQSKTECRLHIRKDHQPQSDQDQPPVATVLFQTFQELGDEVIRQIRECFPQFKNMLHQFLPHYKVLRIVETPSSTTASKEFKKSSNSPSPPNQGNTDGQSKNDLPLSFISVIPPGETIENCESKMIRDMAEKCRDRRLTCSVCKASIVSQKLGSTDQFNSQGIESHVEAAHMIDGNAYFTCSICQALITSRRGMNSHVAHAHRCEPAGTAQVEWSSKAARRGFIQQFHSCFPDTEPHTAYFRMKTTEIRIKGSSSPFKQHLSEREILQHSCAQCSATFRMDTDWKHLAIHINEKHGDVFSTVDGARVSYLLACDQCKSPTIFKVLHDPLCDTERVDVAKNGDSNISKLESLIRKYFPDFDFPRGSNDNQPESNEADEQALTDQLAKTCGPPIFSSTMLQPVIAPAASDDHQRTEQCALCGIQIVLYKKGNRLKVQANNVRSHVEHRHIPHEKPFRCSHCSERFPVSRLTAHIRSAHSKEPPGEVIPLLINPTIRDMISTAIQNCFPQLTPKTISYFDEKYRQMPAIEEDGEEKIESEGGPPKLSVQEIECPETNGPNGMDELSAGGKANAASNSPPKLLKTDEPNQVEQQADLGHFQQQPMILNQPHHEGPGSRRPPNAEYETETEPENGLTHPNQIMEEAENRSADVDERENDTKPQNTIKAAKKLSSAGRDDDLEVEIVSVKSRSPATFKIMINDTNTSAVGDEQAEDPEKERKSERAGTPSKPDIHINNHYQPIPTPHFTPFRGPVPPAPALSGTASQNGQFVQMTSPIFPSFPMPNSSRLPLQQLPFPPSVNPIHQPPFVGGSGQNPRIPVPHPPPSAFHHQFMSPRTQVPPKSVTPPLASTQSSPSTSANQTPPTPNRTNSNQSPKVSQKLEAGGDEGLCTKCDKRFTVFESVVGEDLPGNQARKLLSSVIEAHVEYVHLEGMKPYLCNLCQRYIRSRFGYKSHFERRHAGQNISDGLPLLRKAKYGSLIVAKVFESFPSLINHKSDLESEYRDLATLHEDGTTVLNRKPALKSSRNTCSDAKEGNKRQEICKLCEMQVELNADIGHESELFSHLCHHVESVHLRNDEGGALFACGVCQLKVSTSRFGREHIQDEHGGKGTIVLTKTNVGQNIVDKATECFPVAIQGCGISAEDAIREKYDSLPLKPSVMIKCEAAVNGGRDEPAVEIVSSEQAGDTIMLESEDVILDETDIKKKMCRLCKQLISVADKDGNLVLPKIQTHVEHYHFDGQQLYGCSSCSSAGETDSAIEFISNRAFENHNRRLHASSATIKYLVPKFAPKLGSKMAECFSDYKTSNHQQSESVFLD